MTKYKFSELYDFHGVLGCGGFGFVVSAVDRDSGEHLALKVSLFLIIKLVKRDVSRTADELLR